MAEVQVVRVFTDDEGGFGNLLGVVVDGASVPAEARQPIATELGFSETVFVDDAATGDLRIFTPAVELPFAGHPLVGTAWVLAREGAPATALRPPAGEVPVRYDGEVTWIAGRPEWSPPFEYLQVESADEVDALPGPPDGHTMAAVWAWEDEARGDVRARVFAADLNVAEDEATGSAALVFAAQLDRAIRIRQGRGSIMHARPRGDGTAEVGGRVVLDEVRRLS